MQQYISPQTVLHRRLFNGDGDELGFDWGTIIQIGQAAAQTIPALFGGGSSGQAKGLAAINAFGQQAIQALMQIAQAAQAGQIPAAQAVGEAERIAAMLSNSQYVYQAKNGDDAAALRDFKAQAATIVAQLKAFVGTAPVQTFPGTIPGAPAANADDSGISTTTLLFLGGVALLAIYLLK